MDLSSASLFLTVYSYSGFWKHSVKYFLSRMHILWETTYERRSEKLTVGYYILMFSLGLVLLVWGSGLFVDSAVSLANRFRLPEVLIGATIVSLGTTLPGNAVLDNGVSKKGYLTWLLEMLLVSILCNTGFIAGTLIFLRPVLLKPREVKDVRTGLCFLGTALGLYASCGYLTGGLPRTAGITTVSFIAFFLNSIRRAMGYGHHTHRNVGRRERAGSVVSAQGAAYTLEPPDRKAGVRYQRRHSSHSRSGRYLHRCRFPRGVRTETGPGL